MKIPLKTIHEKANDGYDCFEKAIISISKYLNREYALGFWQAWDFNYSPLDISKKDGLNQCVRPYRPENHKFRLEALKQYHGVEILKKSNVSYNDFLSICQNELSNNKPVIVQLEGFNCPFMKNYYGKVHYNMIHGTIWGYEQNKLYLDEQGVKNVCIEIDDLEKAYQGNLFVINLSDSYDKNVSCNELIKMSTENLIEGNRNVLSDISLFSKDILNVEDIAPCFDTFNLKWQSPMFWCIKNVYKGRIAFSEYIGYIGHRYNEPKLIGYSKDFLDLAENWNRVLLIILKAYQKKTWDKRTREILSQILMNIGKQEEKIFNNLLSY